MLHKQIGWDRKQKGHKLLTQKKKYICLFVLEYLCFIDCATFILLCRNNPWKKCMLVALLENRNWEQTQEIILLHQLTCQSINAIRLFLQNKQTTQQLTHKEWYDPTTQHTHEQMQTQCLPIFISLDMQLEYGVLWSNIINTIYFNYVYKGLDSFSDCRGYMKINHISSFSCCVTFFFFFL